MQCDEGSRHVVRRKYQCSGGGGGAHAVCGQCGQYAGQRSVACGRHVPGRRADCSCVTPVQQYTPTAAVRKEEVISLDVMDWSNNLNRSFSPLLERCGKYERLTQDGRLFQDIDCAGETTKLTKKQTSLFSGKITNTNTKRICNGPINL